MWRGCWLTDTDEIGLYRLPLPAGEGWVEGEAFRSSRPIDSHCLGLAQQEPSSRQQRVGSPKLSDAELTDLHERLRTAVHVELAIGSVDVRLDGANRNDQLCCDLLVCHSRGDETEYLDLPI